LNQEPVTLPLEDAKPESIGRFGAIACALAPLKKSAFQSNLVPPQARYRRSQLQLVPTYILIALTVLLGLGLLGREPYQMMTYASQIDEEVKRIAPTARDVATRQSELNKLSERYRALSGHLQNRDFNLEALREFARSLPPTSWLGNYSYQDGTITVSGTAESATEVQKLLEDSPLFKDVQFTGGVTKDDKERDRFTLKAVIEVAK
jgi:Tfp pilus assembly protein PilN